MYQVKDVAKATGVKESTIRFYEKCGFLETVERLPNGYRVYTEHHLYQVKVCHFVFGGYVNKRLRKCSMQLIEAAKAWDSDAYEAAAAAYREAIGEDIERTKKVIEIAMEGMRTQETSDLQYTKKQAAEAVGTTVESIRNWERNGLIPQTAAYQKRYYSQAVIDRMHVIRLLLDTGYSIMAIFQFLQKMDSGTQAEAKKVLINPEKGEDLLSCADYYLQALYDLQQKADILAGLLPEMKKA